ncbi:hypothetical protein [Clostridium perfringens]|uniref:hypothetical protein n=1 Tax=Clostridium perfringens TaxID=1502 RepID=UPI0023F9CC18|nr:hypothetical protein [Clostridium perfringens]WEV19607.1 hypothetical protein PL323_03005 [Clostridium perfringens D]
MKEIGGFFELELPINREAYHNDAIMLNTARNSLEYVLRVENYKKIYIPYYICSSILEAIKKIDIDFEYYAIDENFTPKINLENLKNDELFLYVNYFGVCLDNVKLLIKKSKDNKFNLCIDNTQAFFIKPSGEDHTIYSARKFFGVPDGAYLYTNKRINRKIKKEITYNKSMHLLKRIDIGANDSYLEFKKNSKLHSNQEIKEMSNLSRRILESIDYSTYKKIRNENFKRLDSVLKNYNEFKINIDYIDGPMIYPFLIKGGEEIKKYLIENNIYVATYWNEVLEKVEMNSTEEYLVKNLIALPIDQRYSDKEMNLILDLINKKLSGGC